MLSLRTEMAKKCLIGKACEWMCQTSLKLKIMESNGTMGEHFYRIVLISRLVLTWHNFRTHPNENFSQLEKLITRTLRRVFSPFVSLSLLTSLSSHATRINYSLQIVFYGRWPLSLSTRANKAHRIEKANPEKNKTTQRKWKWFFHRHFVVYLFYFRCFLCFHGGWVGVRSRTVFGVW